MRWASIGDWDVLARYVREGGKITKAIAGFIADVLEGKIKRPANKAITLKGAEKLVTLVLRVQALMKSEGMNQSAAIDEIAEQEKISRRTIERALQKRDFARDTEEEIKSAQLLIKLLENMRKEAPPEFERYSLSNTARRAYDSKPHP